MIIMTLLVYLKKVARSIVSEKKPQKKYTKEFEKILYFLPKLWYN